MKFHIHRPSRGKIEEIDTHNCEVRLVTIENKNKDGYIINMRLVNYVMDVNGKYNTHEKKIITLIR
jgi:hypothetical protein